MAIEDPRVGSVLGGRYRILERMTAGSMGVVYRAERVGLGRSVVVKILHESYAATEDGLRRFEVEARAMSRLSHPNCVAVTDYGVEEHAPYLVMDFVTGRTLRELVRAEAPLLATRATAIVEQVLSGLSHAHSQNIVHRDVKPENIVVTRLEGQGDQVRILDFGLAKLRDQKSMTSGIALGTPGYMSPEQTIGRSVDNRADVYACGIILYELLVGRKPFVADDAFEVMRMHREVPPPPLSTYAPNARFSQQLEEVVQRALAKEPEDRFESMNDFAIALAQTPEAKGQTGRRRPPWLIPTAAGGAVVLIGLIALLASGGGGGAAKPDPEPTPAPAARDTKATPKRGRAKPAEPPASAAPAIDAAPELAGVAAADAAPGAEREDVAKLREMAAAGDRKQALQELDALRMREPRRADVYYALGNLYTEVQDWQAAVSSYSAALSLDAAYARDERLVADVVEALSNNKAHKRAANLLTTQIGDAALPRLEEATRSANPMLRKRAERVRDELASPGD